MSLLSLLSTMRQRLGSADPEHTVLRLHHLGMSDTDLQALRPMVDGVATQLGVDLTLDARDGDIVVVGGGFAAHVSMQALMAYCEERPLVAIDVADLAGAALERFEQRQHELLGQLRRLPLVQRASRSASEGTPGEARASATSLPPARRDTGFDPGFDSRLDDELPGMPAELQAMVDHLLAGLSDHTLPVLRMGYGPTANLEADFGARLVRMDPAAQQRLRVHHQPPRPTEAAPGLQATARDLDLTVWDFGLACGDHRLLNQPTDWWHTPLRSLGLETLDRYTRTPRQLELGRRLLRAPATPSQLRRHALIGVPELRRFVQACLFVGLVAWEPTPQR